MWMASISHGIVIIMVELFSPPLPKRMKLDLIIWSNNWWRSTGVFIKYVGQFPKNAF